MILKSLALAHFRSFSTNTFYFSPFLTIIFGKNSVGKTNLLESLSLVLTGKGVKEERIDEFIAFKKNSATVTAVLVTDSEKEEFRVTLKKTDLGLEKIFQMNKKVRRLFEYAQSTAPIVLFTPQQIKIIDGSPSKRREYIDDVISRTDKMYRRHLNSYEQGLRRRNKVLEQKKPPELLRQELKYWDDYLEEHANYLTEKRQSYVDFLNMEGKLNRHEFSAKYLANKLNRQTLETSFERSVYTRRTMVGPQKDDFEITLTEKDKSINVHKFGSRSEQRLALFWLILRQLAYFEENISLMPILLLDDIFSELDLLNKGIILTMIKKHQTILTTTEREVIEMIESPHIVINL